MPLTGVRSIRTMKIWRGGEPNKNEDVVAYVDMAISIHLRDERLNELRDKAFSGEKMSDDELQALLNTDPVIVNNLLQGKVENDDK
jgi:hypothetical protein